MTNLLLTTDFTTASTAKPGFGAVRLAWAIGMTYAETGNCLVAPIFAGGRRFLIGAGAPLAVSLDAQNLGKGGDVVVHSGDHQALYPAVRKLFDKVERSEFWRARNITMDKVTKAVVDAGKSENAGTYADKLATVTVPPAKPYLR